MAAVQSAKADITVASPNVNVGFAGGDIASFKFNLASLKSNTLKLSAFATSAHNHGLFFAPGPPVSVRAIASVAAPTGAGKNFNTIGTHATRVTAVIAGRTAGGGVTVPSYSDKYYSFSFLDSSSQTHYGWIYGSLSGGFGDLTYTLMSYAYDTTPNQMITTGQTQVSAVPEPSSLVVVGAMASMILGAAGVRKWIKDREAKATAV
ncbi:MAG: hypothetical protein ACLQIB_55225 [Isosphaeraceae bacterium]